MNSQVPAEVLALLPEADAFSGRAVGWFAPILKVRPRDADRPECADEFSGRAISGTVSLLMPRIPPTADELKASVAAVGERSALDPVDDPCDWLGDVRKARASRDERACAPFDASEAVAAVSALDLPINSSVRSVGQALSSRGVTARPFWPRGKCGCEVLSLDVDNPMGLDSRELLSLGWKVTSREVRLSGILYVGGCVRDFTCEPSGQWHGRCHDFVAAEAKQRVRSTFSHASVSRVDRKAHTLNVQFTRGSPRNAFRVTPLCTKGAEGGRHSAFGSHEGVERFRGQDRCVEEGVRAPIAGLIRNDRYRGTAPCATLDMHSGAWFKHDSFPPLNDRSDFRLSVTPWFSTVPSPRKDISCLQLPVPTVLGAWSPSASSVDTLLPGAAAQLHPIVCQGAVGAVDGRGFTSSLVVRRRSGWGEAYTGCLGSTRLAAILSWPNALLPDLQLRTRGPAWLNHG
jgi:hypothetical protein